MDRLFFLLLLVPVALLQAQLPDLPAAPADSTELLGQGISRFPANRVTDAQPQAGLVVTAEQLLRGQIGGLITQRDSWVPGSASHLYLYGPRVMTGNPNPIFIIDGMPVFPERPRDGEASLSELIGLNPEDIASMQVVTDPAALARYGIQGVKGVVLITTQQGASEQGRLTYHTTFRVSRPARRYPLLQAADWTQYYNEAATYRGDSLLLPPPTTDTDWQEEIFRPAFGTSHQLSYAGLRNKTRYYASGNYFMQEGLLRQDKLQRLSGRLNVQQQLGQRLTLSGRVAYSVTDLPASLANLTRSQSIVNTALLMAPTVPVYDSDGLYTQYYDYFRHSRPYTNPVQQLVDHQSEGTQRELVTQLGATYRLLDRLSLNYHLGYRQRHVTTYRESLLYTFRGYPDTIYSHTYDNYLHKTDQFFSALSATHTQTWREHHVLTSTAGTEVHFWKETMEQYGGDLEGKYTSRRYYRAEQGFRSVWADLTYTFKERYQIQWVNRWDKLYAQLSKHHHGIASAATLTWKVHQENWWSWGGSIPQLELYAGFGKLNGVPEGVEHLGGFSILKPRVGSLPALMFVDWERHYQAKTGVRIALLEGKLWGELTGYSLWGKELMFHMTEGLPPNSGYFPRSGGEMVNRGASLALTGQWKKDRWGYQLSGNVSYNKNKAWPYGQKGAVVMGSGGTWYDTTGGGSGTPKPIHHPTDGQPLGAYRAYLTEGILRDQAAVDAQRVLTTQSDRYITLGGRRFVDRNGSGAIDNKDPFVIGAPVPAWNMGLSQQFRYGAVGLNVSLQGVTGNVILRKQKYELLYNEGWANVTQDRFQNRWTPEHPDATEPRAGYWEPVAYADAFFEPGAYLRIQHVGLTYELPVRSLQAMQFSVGGQNLYTVTRYSGLDPEVADGTDAYAYPSPRTFFIGLKVSL
ncbi:TonB-linked outer membrane protein, SusC/RagA family [Catalinimonas alkaloidigena]|uniref:TonB-linked outer membrane protein, SusC/RagA family n=1 Tax=Catalinimonas alkaloidigena TaxID=1075417 RepID=A0A1G9BPX6_9BACT|nr:SusC/RagA family TonB-linked outer membrane protein [Catalinimonas alkaloidigena]SDK41528.1 TonB-linked outer membrane protein, SusC/RagA family [Catalinimonas alkaloidigena]